MDFIKVTESLKNKGFEVYVENSIKDAVQKCLDLIPQGSTVGWGGSMTCVDSGLIEAVKQKFKVIDRDSANNGDERTLLMRKVLSDADVFLTSFNAVSEDGFIVNIDGNGNRVAAISFGPKTVIALVGKNKIVSSLEDAYTRASTVAAGKNAVRFGKKYEEADSLCNIVQVIRNSGGKNRIKIVFVNEEIGY